MRAQGDAAGKTRGAHMLTRQAGKNRRRAGMGLRGVRGCADVVPERAPRLQSIAVGTEIPSRPPIRGGLRCGTPCRRSPAEHGRAHGTKSTKRTDGGQDAAASFSARTHPAAPLRKKLPRAPDIGPPRRFALEKSLTHPTRGGLPRAKRDAAAGYPVVGGLPCAPAPATRRSAGCKMQIAAHARPSCAPAQPQTGRKFRRAPRQQPRPARPARPGLTPASVEKNSPAPRRHEQERLRKRAGKLLNLPVP